MLCLVRKNGERVVITCPDGSVITVCVQVRGGDRATLAFDAPRDVRIDREEVAHKRDAGDPPPPDSRPFFHRPQGQ